MRRSRRGTAGDGAEGNGTPGFLSLMREAVAGGAAFSSAKKVPAGRAERLGLAVVDPAASTALALPLELDGPLRDWLPGALAVRVEHRNPVTVEVSAGWVMTAIQAAGLVTPDSVALASQGRPGHPGPWPDVLLGLLRDFRDRVPHGQRRPHR